MLPSDTLLTPGWTYVAIVVEGEKVDLNGLDPWRHEWVRRTEDEAIIVAHPQYPDERHGMTAYSIQGPTDVIFAAGEFSNQVWGFYMPDRDPSNNLEGR